MSGSHVKISCHDPVQPSEVSPEDQEICLSSDLASRGPRGSRGPRDAKSMLWQISRSERKEVYFVKLSVSSSSSISFLSVFDHCHVEWRKSPCASEP